MLKKIKKDFFHYLVFEKNLKPNTVINHRSVFNQLVNYFEDKEFDAQNFKGFLAFKKQEGRTAGTIQGYIFTARVLCDFLGLEENWAREIPLPRRQEKLPSVLSVEEIRAILNAPMKYRPSNQTDNNRKKTWDLLLSLLAQSGCRVSEICNLKVRDLDFEEKVFRVLETKTGHPRVVPISPNLIESLKKFVASKEPENFVFTSYRGKPFHYSNVNLELKNRADRVGIVDKPVSSHVFGRHSFITELLRNGAGLIQTAQIVGHRRVVTTQRYTALLTEDLQKAVLKHPLIRK